MRLVWYRGKWAVGFYRPDGTWVRRSLRTHDRALAERRLEDFRRQAATELTVVAEIMEAYLADKNGRIRSIESQKFAWKALRPLFGNLRPDQVSRDRCRQYVAARREAGVGDGTIRRDLGVLRAGLRWADPNSPAVIERPGAPPPDDRHLSKDEYRKLLAACQPTPHLVTFATVCLATGARPGAILDLLWSQVDFERGLIALGPGHGNKGRATVPMTVACRTALEETRMRATTPWVIEWRGERITKVRNAWGKAVKRAGLPPVGPKILRHSAAVWMAEAGIPMEEIAQYLGHSDPRVTARHYARYSPTYLRRAASALEVGRE